MRVFIHPGLHKTGSSSFQEALNLFSKGPQARKRRIEVAISESDIVGVLNSSIESQPETLIISNESLFGDFYDFYSDAHSKMAQLRDTLEGHDIVAVTFCFRSYHRWLESCFAQAIHEGRTQGPNDFVDTLFSLADPLYSTLIKHAHTIFGRDVVGVRFITSRTDVLHEMSAEWSEKLGFALNLRSPARLNASNKNLAALWILHQMNQSPLGRQSNYRTFLQNLPTTSGEKFSVYSEEAQERLTVLQCRDHQEMRQLLRERNSLSRLDEWNYETVNSRQLPEWSWPVGVMPGIAEIFASATKATRLKNDRLRDLKEFIVKVLGPWVVGVWGLLKGSRSVKRKD